VRKEAFLHYEAELDDDIVRVFHRRLSTSPFNQISNSAYIGPQTPFSTGWVSSLTYLLLTKLIKSSNPLLSAEMAANNSSFTAMLPITELPQLQDWSIAVLLAAVATLFYFIGYTSSTTTCQNSQTVKKNATTQDFQKSCIFFQDMQKILTKSRYEGSSAYPFDMIYNPNGCSYRTTYFVRENTDEEIVRLAFFGHCNCPFRD